jgi:1-hydroxycarotenoid 3,4-desaturase
LARKVIILGAGIGGLAAALELSARGCDVTVVEKEAAPGGKIRQVFPNHALSGDSRPIDAGPTVFTMRRVFDELFALAGTTLENELRPVKLSILARHAWDIEGKRHQQLDLHANLDASADAIGSFAGSRNAQGFRDFTADARRIFDTLDTSFMRAPRPGPLGLLRNVGWLRAADLLATRPFAKLWSALGDYFPDPRLHQLFGRYATYNGSSPFEAPATLMLIAHAELEGVWSLEGGMHALATCFQRLGEKHGAQFRYDARVARVEPSSSGPHRVILTTGEELTADAVVCNADVAALATGLLGTSLTGTASAPPSKRRSLSAVTWCLDAPTSGFDMTRHNVFFSSDYAAEFDDIRRARRLPRSPTVYVCAQDRGDAAAPVPQDRLLCLINAPADGDTAPLTEAALREASEATFGIMERCGLQVDRSAPTILTTPTDFNRLFPATGGALYGAATHGPFTSFQRAGARTRIPGLYLCGGSVHPSAGVPMAAQSGRLAAAAVIDDF